MKQPIFSDKHFYIWLALFIACTIFYYFGELVNLFGWEVLRWDIFYTVHDPHRMLFLIPILYSSYYFRLRGALLANVMSLLIFLPRAFFISPYPDATLRMVAFVILAIVISMLTALTFNDRDKRHKLTDALKQAEEKNRIVMEQMYDSFFEVDLAGNFTLVNDSVCKNLGYSREELMGNNYRLAVPGDAIELLLVAYNEVFTTGEPNQGFEHKILRKDGSIILVESSISQRKNEQGEIIGFRSVSRDITERKRVEAALQESGERFSAVFNINPDPIAVVEGDTARRILVNSAFVKWSGYSHDELIGATIDQLLVHPEDRARIATQFRNSNGLSDFEIQLRRKNGEIRDTQFSVIIIEIGGKTYLFSRIHDITERKIMERAVRESEEKYRSLVENINDVFYVLDNQGNITYVSPVVERLSKYKVSDLIGKPFIPLVYPDDLPALLESFERMVTGQLEPWEFRILDKDGRIIWVRTSSRPLYDDGQVVGVTALMTDITGRKQMEQKLEEMATHDFLTGLPNRVLLLDRFNIAAALAQRNKARLAVMSLDLDKFKTINDTLGHDAGDQVLKAVSTRLMGIIRASDTLARVGGDEFILVMLDTKRREDDAIIAQKILDVFKEPLIVDGHGLHLSTSIGIAIYPEDAQDLETLTKKSDAAMYYSKGHGRDQFKFFGDGDVGISGDHRSAPN